MWMVSLVWRTTVQNCLRACRCSLHGLCLENPGPRQPRADGRFRLTAFPGDYSVLPVAPPGYAVTDLRYGGANYLNSLIPIRGASADSSLTIVLTDQPSSVTGSI